MERSTRCPHDFDAKGLSLRPRLGHGTPLYVENMNGDLCYEDAAQLNCMGGNGSTRLDHVILSLGKLYTQFEAWLGKFPSEHERESNIAVLKSLERRWAEADQDLFIAATERNGTRIPSASETCASSALY